MNSILKDLLKKAVRLTRHGELRNATTTIQNALRDAGLMGRGSAAPMPTSWPRPQAQPQSQPQSQPQPQPQSQSQPQSPPQAQPRSQWQPQSQPPPQPTPGSETPRPARPPGDDRFIDGRHAEPNGLHRDYKLYLPPGAEAAGAGSVAAPLPLLVMLHGCKQDPADFAAGTAMNELAREQGFVVLYPGQSQRANLQGCWNWFSRQHQARGAGEPALIAGVTRAVMQAHAIDPRRVYVAGLSAGGAMAAIVANAYPDLYAAAGVHSGLAAGAAGDVASAFAAMKNGAASPPPAGSGSVPTIVFHGDADATVNPHNGAQVIAASVGPATLVERIESARGQAAPRGHTQLVYRHPDGTVAAEHWIVHGSPHAWSGGRAAGSYTDAAGPDASAEMLRFFLAHPRPVVH